MKLSLLLVAVLLVGCVSYRRTPVAAEMLEDDYVRRFVKTKCGYDWDEKAEQPEPRRKECGEKWGVEFGKRLQKAYPGVDIAKLLARCEASLRACDPAYLESWAQDEQEVAPAKPETATKPAPPANVCKSLATPCD